VKTSRILDISSASQTVGDLIDLSFCSSTLLVGHLYFRKASCSNVAQTPIRMELHGDNAFP
jgi:hypothetical protein